MADHSQDAPRSNSTFGAIAILATILAVVLITTSVGSGTQKALLSALVVGFAAAFGVASIKDKNITFSIIAAALGIPTLMVIALS